MAAKDQYGNTDPTYTGTVTFSGKDSNNVAIPAGQLPTDSPYTFSSGDHGTRAFTLTLTTADTLTIKVTDNSLPTAFSSQNVTITPAATSQLVFSALAGSATVGSPTTFTLTAEDTYGNVTPSYAGTVHFTSTDGAAVLPPDHTFDGTDSGSHAGFSVTFNTAGSWTLAAQDTASGSTIAGTSASVTAS